VERFDAIVCGGGPAGACAAWRLASAGASCLVIGHGVPGGKVCGGALGTRAKKHLISSGMLSADDLSRLSLREQPSMTCFHGYEPLRAFTSPGDPITMIDRLSFDAFLLDRAERAGAAVLGDDPVAAVRDGGGRVETRSGNVFAAGATIGADGAAGPVGMSFRPPGRRHPAGVALECFIGMPSGFPEEIGIHFGLTDYGYAWVFPRRDDVCVGIGSLGGRASPPALLEALERLMRRLGLEPPGRGALRAAPIPSGRPSRKLGAGRVFLAGDAAGLTDRLTGEGLSHAVESGFLAAEAVIAGWDRKRLSRTALRGCLGIVRESCLARHLVYHPLFRNRAMRGLRENAKFFEGYWGLVSGNTGYAGMLAGFLRRK